MVAKTEDNFQFCENTHWNVTFVDPVDMDERMETLERQHARYTYTAFNFGFAHEYFEILI